MEQKTHESTIEERFRLARNDPSMVVIEGFHPLKHAIRFGAELLEVVSPNLKELAALQSEYAPDIGTTINDMVTAVPGDIFEKLAPVSPPTGPTYVRDGQQSADKAGHPIVGICNVMKKVETQFLM